MMKQSTAIFAICLILTLWLDMPAMQASHFSSGTQTAIQFGVHEIELTGDGQVENPFDTIATVQFTPASGTGNAKTVWAFYDGENTWRARVYLSEIGEWSWTSNCTSDSRLNGKSGKFTCEASKLPGRLLVHPKNPRQWMTENGRWHLNLNDTAYFLLCEHDGNGRVVTDAEAKQYVKDDIAHGITSIRCFLASGKKGFVESSEQWKNWYFRDDTFSLFQLKNLQSADRRLRVLLDDFPDVAIQLILFPLEAYGRDDKFWAALSPPQRERLLRQLVSRYAAFPQLFWLITNDAHYGEKFTNSNALAREVGAYLQKHDAWQHPRSTGHARRIPFFFGNEDWATYIHLEHDHDLGAQQYDRYHAFAKPVFLGEDRYEQDHGPSRDPHHMQYWQRRLIWAWTLSGGSTNYGGRWWAVDPYSETSIRTATFHKRPATTFKEKLTGLDSVVHIREYFTKRNIDLSNFEPDHAMVKDPAINDSVRAPKLMRQGQQELLIYHPNAAADGQLSNVDVSRTASLVVDLSAAQGQFSVEWFRAVDGVTQSAATVVGGKAFQLTAPWSGQDVVLRLRREPGKTASVEPAEETRSHAHRPDNAGLDQPPANLKQYLQPPAEFSKSLTELHALMAPRPFFVLGGAEDPPLRWQALNDLVAVNQLLGVENRVAMTNRRAHAPTPESNDQLYAFFEWALADRN